MTGIGSYTTEKDVSIKDLVADKIGYSSEYFYLGETEDGKSIYHGYRTTTLVGERIISICGEQPEDIEREHKKLEKMTDTKLILFIKSKQYQRV